MAISSIKELYSKRFKENKRAEIPDSLEYERFSPEFRRQIIYLLEQLTVGMCGQPPLYNNDFFTQIQEIVYTLREEYGKDHLTYSYLSESHYTSKGRESFRELENFIRDENFSKTEQCLDAIELIFGNRIIGFGEDNKKYYSQLYDKAIDKLNQRFREHNLGYRFAGNSIVRSDSEVSFQNINKPALNLLQEAEFTIVNRKYADVLQLHRKGDYRKVIAECRIIYESLLKHIIEKMGDKPKNKVSDLVDKLVELDLIPNEPIIVKFFKQCLVVHSAAHGEGEKPTIQYDQYMAELILNNTGSAIIFLVRKYISKNKK